MMSKFNMQEMLDVIVEFKCDELWMVPRESRCILRHYIEILTWCCYSAFDPTCQRSACRGLRFGQCCTIQHGSGASGQGNHRQVGQAVPTRTHPSSMGNDREHICHHPHASCRADVRKCRQGREGGARNRGQDHRPRVRGPRRKGFGRRRKWRGMCCGRNSMIFLVKTHMSTQGVADHDGFSFAV